MTNIPPPLPDSPPPLPGSRGRNLFVGFATASWASVLMGVAASAVFSTVAANPMTGGAFSRMIIGVLCGVLLLVGIISGITALCGVPRYGSSGILLPALIGLLIWGGLAAIAVPSFLRARDRALAARAPTQLTPARHNPSVETLHDEALGFTLDLPEGYVSIDPAKIPGGFSYVYRKNRQGEENMCLMIKPIGVVLPKNFQPGPAQIPKGSAVSLTTFNWRGLTVDAYKVPETFGGVKYLTFNVQAPLKKQAVQFGLVGPEAKETELRATAVRLLTSLDAETNW